MKYKVITTEKGKVVIDETLIEVNTDTHGWQPLANLTIKKL